jgi:hypothetical protein
MAIIATKINKKWKPSIYNQSGNAICPSSIFQNVPDFKYWCK